MLLLRTYFIASYSCRFASSLTRVIRGGSARDQVIRTMINDNVTDWNSIKEQALKVEDKYSTINENNFDNLLLKMMVSNKKFEMAQMFVEYLKSKGELSLAHRNGILLLYYEMGKNKKLPEAQKQVILDNYKYLYEKYNVLDSTTCETLLQALCIIDEWEKALKVLENIFITNKPSHMAFSALIGTLFRVNKKKEALELIEKSLSAGRQFGYLAYCEWIEYILRKYKTKSTILTHLEEILLFINDNNVSIPQGAAEKLCEVYRSLNWSAEFVGINKISGQCSSCKTALGCLKLTEDEFKELQANVRDKLIMGTDLMLKSTPQELSRFQEFVKKTAPYDFVLDGLNIAYTSKLHNRLVLLKEAVNYFTKNNRRVLLIGRKHMLNWPKHQMQYLMDNACCFFTEDLSQDDPYIITAAILSGSHTDIVSRDLLRPHMFRMEQPRLRLLFQRWQWQHQWRGISRFNKLPIYQRPLKFTPCSQKIECTWHIPFKPDVVETKDENQLNDGTPDLAHWVCLRPNADR